MPNYPVAERFPTKSPYYSTCLISKPCFAYYRMAKRATGLAASGSSAMTGIRGRASTAICSHYAYNDNDSRRFWPLLPVLLPVLLLLVLVLLLETMTA